MNFQPNPNNLRLDFLCAMCVNNGLLVKDNFINKDKRNSCFFGSGSKLSSSQHVYLHGISCDGSVHIFCPHPLKTLPGKLDAVPRWCHHQHSHSGVYYDKTKSKILNVNDKDLNTWRKTGSASLVI